MLDIIVVLSKFSQLLLHGVSCFCDIQITGAKHETPCSHNCESSNTLSISQSIYIYTGNYIYMYIHNMYIYIYIRIAENTRVGTLVGIPINLIFLQNLYKKLNVRQ